MDYARSHSSSGQLISVPRSDRWLAHQRLQELGISCACLRDGSFQVEIHNPVEAVQLRSVVLQLTAPRHQLLSWLNQCWQLS
jgi:hypothetical protein